ncbi:twin-arginine translocase TatA/TatE family subunit [Helicobacter mehlei]|uniref:Sec-independent protein translocase protein TatA n=1 Tax=Helicobacter mehlei TaxID=2316080 RepID=A0A553UMG5_9HELI|nr:twin-arginine translocase TatA/TatE family subunit [Helicobacter mehlei]TSA81412.1 twin-arginine translocase TatA/TatE family subunit [Helicobacter mehlei]
MGGFTSIWHWVIVLFVILLLFGAKKIPELAKGLGSGIKNFKKAIKEDEEEGKAKSEEVKVVDSPSPAQPTTATPSQPQHATSSDAPKQHL